MMPMCCKVHFPVDYVTGNKIAGDAKVGHADDASGIPSGMKGLDVGPKSRVLFREVILRARSIFFNG